MGRVGSSMNFSWTFIGDPVTINWGIKRAGANDFESNGRILSVAKDGTQRVENQGYNGRVNGIWSGNSQSAQVVFTLSTIEMKDMESYLCMLRGGFGESHQFDYLKLVVEGQPLRFHSPYVKKKVTGRIGHSVTFVWKFSGGVDAVIWGLANKKSINRISGRLIYLNRRNVDVLSPGLVPVAYRGRVNGTRTGDSSFGQASFTLYNVTKHDERFYGCLLTPDDPNEPEISDLVQLAVVGMYIYRDLATQGRGRHLVT